jgi:hypothetical protein
MKNSPGHCRMVWEMIMGIYKYPGPRSHHGITYPGHSQYISRMVQDIVYRVIYGPEQNGVIGKTVQDN